MTNSIDDVTQESDLIMLVGSNPEEAHPVIGMQIRAAVERGCKLIVVDPRDIGLTAYADIRIKLKPGTNVAYANGIMHVLIKEGLIDKDYIADRTQGIDELAKIVEDCTPARTAAICDIDERDLIAAAKLYAAAPRAAIVYCLGVTEHSTGTDGVMSLSNIAMATGNLGKRGGGVNPLRGQNNVQGACDMGAGPDDFPGYQKVANPKVLAKFEQAWGTKLSAVKGIKATECFPAMTEGKIKALFMFGEDPVRTDPDTHHVIEALKSLEFFAVVDLFMTETAKYADVILPGRSFAEKEGTFSNTERRVQRVRKAVDIEGDTLPDSEIFIEIMNRMGYKQPALTPAEVMGEIASLTPSYGGVSHARLDSEELDGRGLQWPCPDANHPGTPVLHMNGFTKGKGEFAVPVYQPSAELPDAEYPLVLSTGRVLSQYNAQAMTGRVSGLNEIEGSSFIEINSKDAANLGIEDGECVSVSSRRGSIKSVARVSEKTKPGQTWMPFHFQDGNSNWLTIAALDSIAKAPEFKVCAIKVEKLV